MLNASPSIKLNKWIIKTAKRNLLDLKFLFKNNLDNLLSATIDIDRCPIVN